jgi:hypothetical protein
VSKVSLTEGVDTDGNLVRLGGEDSKGYPIGYIDEHGLAWESILERDIAMSFEPYDVAYLDWIRGVKRRKPSLWWAAFRHSLIKNPRHLWRVVKGIRDDARFWHEVRKMKGIL